MEDLVCLLLPRNNLIDPFGPGGGKCGDEGFHHALVDLRCLLNENSCLFGILANVKFSCGEDGVDLHISNGREATEVPRVLITGFIKRSFQIWKE